MVTYLGMEDVGFFVITVKVEPFYDLTFLVFTEPLCIKKSWQVCWFCPVVKRHLFTDTNSGFCLTGLMNKCGFID